MNYEQKALNMALNMVEESLSQQPRGDALALADHGPYMEKELIRELVAALGLASAFLETGIIPLGPYWFSEIREPTSKKEMIAWCVTALRHAREAGYA